MGKGRVAFLGLLLTAGCTSTGRFEPPRFIPPGEEVILANGNPVFIELGHKQYGYVFEACLKVLLDYDFEIMESNRYDGRIETRPRVAPGLFNCVRPGSPEFRERLLATAQSYRHRVSVNIQPADNSGYFVEVIVRKELEDLPKPVRGTVGGAVFRSENSVERQFEVIDPAFFEPRWIYKGRDAALEQELIHRLVSCVSAAGR